MLFMPLIVCCFLVYFSKLHLVNLCIWPNAQRICPMQLMKQCCLFLRKEKIRILN